MRSLLAYAERDGTVPVKGGVLLVQLGVIDTVHRRLGLPLPGEQFRGRIVVQYGQAESIRAFVDGLKADFGFCESRGGFVFLFALLLEQEVQRLETEELIARQLERLDLVFPWQHRHDLFIYDPAKAKKVLMVFLETCARYTWHDDYERQLALRPTRRDADTGMVIEAVCGFCVCMHEASELYSDKPPPINQVWEWPFRLEVITKHAVAEHATAYAELNRLVTVRMKAVKDDNIREAEAAIQHFLEHPIVPVSTATEESTETLNQTRQSDRERTLQQREKQLSRSEQGLKRLEDVLQERERLCEKEQKANRQREHELDNWDNSLRERELECDRRQFQHLEQEQELYDWKKQEIEALQQWKQLRELEFSHQENKSNKQGAESAPERENSRGSNLHQLNDEDDPEQVERYDESEHKLHKETRGAGKRELRDWDHELGERKEACDRVQDKYLQLTQDMYAWKRQEEAEQSKWKLQREQEFREWERQLREREMACIRQEWRGQHKKQRK
ncbi:unnamed protein product [Phytophthora lilii]|uniref:Unnamed protein product n=1 Tax=Phytophthora lilii TaxID=2077276 RepID=A0A9W6THN1_9STRA|nr:unnamed protein product [Phytophthora lilii]